MFVGEVLSVAISCLVMMIEVVEWVLEAVMVEVAEARMLPTPLISIGLTYLTCLTGLAFSRLRLSCQAVDYSTDCSSRSGVVAS